MWYSIKYKKILDIGILYGVDIFLLILVTFQSIDWSEPYKLRKWIVQPKADI
jgi:hypothetical protein